MMAGGIAALVLATTVATVPGGFAPQVEQRYRLNSEIERSDGTNTRHFVVAHDVVFHRTETGFIADVTALPPPQPVSGPEAMFAAAYTALAGQTIRYRLDATGKLTGIDDLDRVWERYVGAIEQMAGAGNPRAKVFADALRARSPSERLAGLASPIEAMIAVIPPLGDHPIAIGASNLDGSKRNLVGRRRVSRGPDGLLHVETNVRSTGDDAGTTAETELLIDPVTRLTRQRRQRSVTSLAGGTLSVTTTTTLALVS